MMNKLVKSIYALWEGWSVFVPTRNPKLIMTLLVKNEEELLEANLCFHKSMGVDAFIVTDNNSTDRTPLIIEKYVRKGWIVEVIHETVTGYEQKAWVDRMIWDAKTVHHADWVINADADEFWYTPSYSLKNVISRVRANVLSCEVKSMYPDEHLPFYKWEYAVKPVPNPAVYGLSGFSIFAPQKHKVIHRTKGYLQISMGNHKVAMFPPFIVKPPVVVYHYNIRGRRQFIEKMVNGGKELEQHKGQHGGRHWRYFYRLYKEGKLNEEYDKIVGSAIQGSMKESGFIHRDCSMADSFKKLGI